MKRREFITLLGGAAAAWPNAARAQQAMPIVGFLSPRSARDSTPAVAAFRRGLHQEGYVEGRNVVIDYRWGEGQRDQLRALAADLVRRQVAVIVAISPPAALVAKSATATIPIVFTSGDDPIKAGLVTSLSRPEGNATGVSFFSGVLGAKRLELVRMLLPKTNAIALLLNPLNSRSSDEQTLDVQQAAHALGVQLRLFHASRDEELASAFEAIAQSSIDALLVSAEPFFSSKAARIPELAAQHKVPTIYSQRDFVPAGGLMSYGASLIDSYRQVGVYVGQILKGEKPGDLPVVQPTKFELVINFKTARVLGLTVPDKLIALADEVVE